MSPREVEEPSGRRLPRLLLPLGAAVLAALTAALVVPRLLDPVEETAALPLVSASDPSTSTEEVPLEITPESLVEWLAAELAAQGVASDGVTCDPSAPLAAGSTISCSAVLDHAALAVVVQVAGDDVAIPFAIVHQSFSATVSS